MTHERTAGTVEWEGKTYEIDWPHDPDDETQRNPIAGFIYLDGEMVGEAPAPWGMDFTDACPHTQRGVTWAEGDTTCYVCETCEHEWTERD